MKTKTSSKKRPSEAFETALVAVWHNPNTKKRATEMAALIRDSREANALVGSLQRHLENNGSFAVLGTAIAMGIVIGAEMTSARLQKK